MPYPGLLHPEPLPCSSPLLTRTSSGGTGQQWTADPYLLRRHPNTVLAQSLGSLGPGMHKVCLNPLSVSGG